MIIDSLDNSQQYSAVNPNIGRAFEYLLQTNLSELNVGRLDIAGEEIYALVQQYNTKPKEQGFWEAHRRYIDLQVVIQGSEKIGYANLNRLTQGEYDTKKDFLPLTGEGEFLILNAGDFMLLFPADAHMPGIAVASPISVKKIVVKIKV